MDNKIFDTHHITIDKESLASLPCAVFEKEAVVIDRLDDVDKAIERLEKARIIGFDTETKPSFRKGVTHQVSLVQLSTPDVCFLFRLNKIGFPERLVRLLESEEHLKIGLSLRDDFHNLSKQHKFTPGGFVDLQKMVKEFHITDISLTRIHAILFGQRISKGQRLTNWEADMLSPTQISYAALDAYSCIRIYDYLQSGEFHPEECRYLTEIPAPPVQE